MTAPRLTIGPAVDGVAHAYPASLFAEGLLTVQPGKTLAVLGASGSGKTTLLRVLAGLAPTDGWAVWDGAKRFQKTALMAQNDVLLPWFSVADNIMLGPRLRGEEPDLQRCDALLDEVGLADVRDALPETLSGGMQQRAALARSLYEDADLLLLDEPYSSLDAITRRQMQQLTVRATAGRTLVLVTHDPDEAWLMGHRIVVLEGRPARFVEVARDGSVSALWDRVLQRGPEHGVSAT